MPPEAYHPNLDQDKNRSGFIGFVPPETSPYQLGLETLLPQLHEKVPGIYPGQVLGKHEAFIAATSLFIQPGLDNAMIRAMNFELPSWEDHKTAKSTDPVLGLHLWLDGLRYARATGAEIEINLDIFTNWHKNGGLDFGNFRAHHRNGESYPQKVVPDDRLSRNQRLTIHNYSKVAREKRHALLTKPSIHTFAELVPILPINIFRHHDHRKGMFYEYADGQKIALLNTFNLEQPLAHDCGLVITNPNLYQAFYALMETSPFNHAVIPDSVGSDWMLYQDGILDLDPHKPLETSVILSRVRNLIEDDNTKELVWTSQFLPDLSDLICIARRLEWDQDFRIELFAPKPKLWSGFYKASGGYFSQYYARRLGRKYPDRFTLNYTQRYLHTKSIMINNGEIILIGSHNFNRLLTSLLTAEIVLESRADAIIDSTSYKQHIATLRQDLAT